MATDNGQPAGSLSLGGNNGGAVPSPRKINYGLRDRFAHRGSTYSPSVPFKVSSQQDNEPKAFYADFNDPSDVLANQRKQYIEIYHIPTKKRIFFKSFLTDFGDSFKADYQKEAVFGRMDPIATYKRTGRVIKLAWDMPSSGLNEAKDNMAKINLLIQMLYPVYDTPQGGKGGATTMRSGPIFKVKMGNLIMQPGRAAVTGPASEAGLSGIIEGFNYAPDLKQGVFDPASDVSYNPDGTKKIQYDGTLYPKSVKAQIQFTVIHDTPLGWEMNSQDDAKLRNAAADGGGEAERFPYGGNNSPVDFLQAQRAGPAVKQADWRSYLDLQKDLIKRRIDVRANKLLQPMNDTKGFFNL